jgi:hypothetical protein
VHDFVEALQRAMPAADWRAILTALAAAVASWWIYVPLHELLHAFGCIATGGSVGRLEISPEYGAAALQRIFPFVAVGSNYAGQLVEFDTRGSDLTYLATVFAPYLLTVVVGVPLLREIGRRARPGATWSGALGAAIPVAYASFANVAGDYYELGSIPVSRAAAALLEGADAARWRADDLPLLIRDLRAEGGLGLADVATVAAGFVLGAAFAFATYWLGGALHRIIAPRPAPPGR